MKDTNIELKTPELITYMNMIDYKRKYESAKEMYDKYKYNFKKQIREEYGILLEDNNYMILSEMGRFYLKLIFRNADI